MRQLDTFACDERTRNAIRWEASSTVERIGRAGVCKWAATLLMVFLAPLAALADEASTYPDRPIHVVVPFSPGGAGDVLARLIGDKLAKRFSQRVIVENRPGANTITASQYVARASADGYTLYSANTAIVQAPMLSDAGYDEERDFVPVAQYALGPLVLVIRAENPAKNVKELLAYLKARSGTTSYGTVGTGGTQHIYGEAIKRASGIDSVQVPYKGESPLLTDFLGGRLDWYFASPVSVMPHVRKGTVRILAVTGDQRLPLAPDVPTFKEEGFEDLAVVGWQAMFAPAKTPKSIVAKLSKEIAAISKEPDVKNYLSENGMIPTGLTAEEFGKTLPQFRDSFRRMIKENNIKIQ